MTTTFRRLLQTASAPLRAAVSSPIFTLPMVRPERIFIAATPHVPNSKLPVLVYRSVFQGLNSEQIAQHLHGNSWLKGGQWKTYRVPHFHTNSHECYAVLKGESILSLGKSPLDWDVSADGYEIGKRIHVAQGDVFVLPAGVSYCSTDSKSDYQQVGFYPKGSPKWDIHFCKEEPEETVKKAAQCLKVPVPEIDPIYGSSGPLLKFWRGYQQNPSQSL